MREILFRGKREDNGEWVEGGYYIEKIGDYLTAAFIVENLTDGVHENHRVIPKSISEFTGLTDKNGKKIFEGDIVAGALHWIERKENGIVTFRDGSFGLLWYRGEVEQFNAFTSMCNVKYEVIGNIHDTPELLKGENDA